VKRTPLHRKSRLKTRARLRRYTELRARGQRREWRKVRTWCQHRADGWCEARIEGVCTGRGEHAHHIQMRSQGGTDDLGNLLWTCPSCHDAIHRNPEASYAAGWLRRRAAVAGLGEEENRG
jgi:hypothetical protein